MVMDANAFGETIDPKQRIYEREMRVCEAVVQSERDFAQCGGMSLEEVRRARGPRPSALSANLPPKARIERPS